MYRYGRTSKARLETCHPKLQRVFNEAIKYMDISILEGKRGKEKQDEYFRTGASTVKWPNSKHNVADEFGNEIDGYSRAIDAGPYDPVLRNVDYEDTERYTLFAGFIIGLAKGMGIDIVWGVDWDSDWKTKDHKFKDYPHFQLAEHEV